MKRFWLVLLSLGLVMGFSVSAFAVDVKVGAEYFVGGLYLNKTSLSTEYPENTDVSTAFFYQRLRVGTDFIVSPSLKLVTQFDAMERIWGGMRSSTDPSQASVFFPTESAGTRAETENIAVNVVYIDYASPIGLFKVGYMPDYVWGTVFGDNGSALYDGQIQYFVPVGPFTISAGYSKRYDYSYSAVSSTSWSSYVRDYMSRKTDRDYDSYRLAAIYNFKGGEAGALLLWDRDATNRGSQGNPTSFWDNYLTNAYVIDPYVKAKIGPVALQAEAQYWFGDYMKHEGYSGQTNVSIDALSVFVDATADLGMFYTGGTFAYLSGPDPNKEDRVTGGINTGGYDWNPCLIMFNTETLGNWVGTIYANNPVISNLDMPMTNAWFFQGRVGVKPNPQWSIMLSLSYAFADKKVVWGVLTPEQVPNGTYGTEIDLSATYKITNNLSYMLGGAYLFTGDYFKGLDPIGTWKTQDDYLLINKLTLSF